MNIEDLKKQVELLDYEIEKLSFIRGNLQRLIKDEINIQYNDFTPIIDKYLNIDLDRDKQQELYARLNNTKISTVLKHFRSKYNAEYTKVDGDTWSHLKITRKKEY